MKYQNKLDGNYTKNALDDLGMTPRPIRNHQKIIAAFIRNIPVPENAMILPETEIGTANSPAPDVVVFINDIPFTFIEVCHNKGQKNALTKTMQVLKDYNIAEAFVYNYQTDTFFRVTQKEIQKNKSFSEILEIDLQGLQFY